MNASSYPQTSGNESFSIPMERPAPGSSWRDRGFFPGCSEPASPAFRSEGSSIFDKYEREMRQFQAEHGAAIDEVRRRFILSAAEPVITFLNQHKVVIQLLLDAKMPIQLCFGEDTICSLRLPADDIGSSTIYAVVMWPGAVSDVRCALQKFDESWWFAHLQHASGHLSFTYELV